MGTDTHLSRPAAKLPPSLTGITLKGKGISLASPRGVRTPGINHNVVPPKQNSPWGRILPQRAVITTRQAETPGSGVTPNNHSRPCLFQR